MRIALATVGLMIACGGGAAPPGPTGPHAVPRPGDPPSDLVVAKWEGGSLTYGEVHGEVAVDLRIMEIRAELDRFDVLSRTVERRVFEEVLRAEAARQGHRDVEALLGAEVEGKVPAPTDAQVASYYALVEGQLAGAPLEEVRPMLEAELVHQAQVERYRDYLDGLRTRYGIDLAVPYPDLPRIEVPVGADDPTRGPADAPVTIVQFAEYECQHCAAVAPTLDRLLTAYDGRVRLVFKDFPLPGHGRAFASAIATHCADEQGRYAAYGAVLHANPTALSDSDMVGYAEQLALDANEFEKCMTSGRHDPGIYADIEQGRSAGVTATPTFFINGVFVSGAQPYERFADLVERELGETSPTVGRAWP